MFKFYKILIIEFSLYHKIKDIESYEIISRILNFIFLYKMY